MCILKEGRCANLNVFSVVLVIIMSVSFVCCWPGGAIVADGSSWVLPVVGERATVGGGGVGIKDKWVHVE